MPPQFERQWRLNVQDAAAARRLSHALGITPLTARILINRGIREPERADLFLNPRFAHLHDPNLMHDMDKAIHRTLEAIRDSDPILVYGDSDVDGITAAVCVYQFLSRLGLDTSCHIPGRTDEGYGLTNSAVERAAADGIRLIITTDCGISNHESIALAKTHGIDTIVIDHHTLPAQLPVASAILNPLQPECAFPFKRLAAVGVSFNFIMALNRTLSDLGAFPNGSPSMRDYLDLVALGTVADAVPLIDENRIFVRLGLEVLRRRRRPGTQALMDRAQVEGRPVTARTIGYRLAPLINAAGRMGDANRCVELLSTGSYRRALALAQELEKDNARRQQAERDILKEATRMAEEQFDQGRHLLMLSGEGWHEGVLGIVASRIKELFHRPSALVAINPTSKRARVSLRAIAGVDLIAAMTPLEDRLNSFGGHTAAAGMSLHADNLEEVYTALNDAIGLQLANPPVPQLNLDTFASLDELGDNFLDDLGALAPFGVGHGEPALLVEQVRCVRRRIVGERHLRLQVRGGQTISEAIGFALASQYSILSQDVDMALTPRRTTHRGQPKMELHIKDLRTAGTGSLVRLPLQNPTPAGGH